MKKILCEHSTGFCTEPSECPFGKDMETHVECRHPEQITMPQPVLCAYSNLEMLKVPPPENCPLLSQPCSVVVVVKEERE